MDEFLIDLPHGGGTQHPDRVVLHAMSEYIDVDARTATKYKIAKGRTHALFFLYAIGLSAHALVTPDGGVICCRDPLLSAWHAKGHNRDSLGIEFLVPGMHDYAQFLAAMKTDYVTGAAYAAGRRHVRSWLDDFDIAADQVTTHSAIDPTRKYDPGAGFPIARFLEDLR